MGTRSYTEKRPTPRIFQRSLVYVHGRRRMQKGWGERISRPALPRYPVDVLLGLLHPAALSTAPAAPQAEHPGSPTPARDACFNGVH